MTSKNGTTYKSKLVPFSLNQDTVAMVNLVLNDLSRPSMKGPLFCLETCILISNCNRPVAHNLPSSRKRQTPLFCLIRLSKPNDLRIKHHYGSPFIVKHNDALRNTDHIGSHPNASIFVCFKGVQQILSNRKILVCCRRGFLRKKKNDLS